MTPLPSPVSVEELRDRLEVSERAFALLLAESDKDFMSAQTWRTSAIDAGHRLNEAEARACVFAFFAGMAGGELDDARAAIRSPVRTMGVSLAEVIASRNEHAGEYGAQLAEAHETIASLRSDLQRKTRALEATSKVIRNNLTCWCEKCGGGCMYCYSLELADAALNPSEPKEKP